MASFRPNSGGALAASKQAGRKSPLAAAGLASVGSQSGSGNWNHGSTNNNNNNNSNSNSNSNNSNNKSSSINNNGLEGALLRKEQDTLTEGESGVATDKRRIQMLERKLKEELYPDVAEAKGKASANKQAQESVRQSLGALGAARLQASQQVGELNKRELAEIKRLAKNPPMAVRHTLAACWLLLSSGLFRNKPPSAVKFDDAKDWAKIQKLLATDSFIPEILNFDTALLASAPEVSRHVASLYLGLELADASSKGKPGSAVPSKGSAPEAPLTDDIVNRSSRACAALFSWMLELMREFVERLKLEAQLKQLKEEEEPLKERQSSAEQAVAAAEAELVTLKEAAARQEAELRNLRTEETMAKRAAKDLDQLEQLMREGPAATLDKKQSSPSEGKSTQKPQRKRAKGDDDEEDEGGDDDEENDEKERPKPRKAAASPKALEVEYCGSMAHVDHDLARLYIPFENGESALLDGDPQQAVVLLKVAAFLSDRKSTLKVLLEGRRTKDESEDLATARSLSVFSYLVNVAACRPSCLRIGGGSRSLSSESGVACVPIHELRVAAGEEEAVPVHFQVGSVALSNRAKEGLKVAAALVVEDDLTICVEGHCHKSGEEESIASARCAMVFEELVLLGVRESQLETRDCGSRHPVSRLSGEPNCRVELHIVQ